MVRKTLRKNNYKNNNFCSKSEKQLVCVLWSVSEGGAEKVTSAAAAAAAVGVASLSSSSTKTSLAADPLASLAKQLGGSKRNALLRWCQNRTAAYTVS